MVFHTGGHSRSYIELIYYISSIYGVQLFSRSSSGAGKCTGELRDELREEWAQKPIFRVKLAPYAAEKVEPARIHLVGVVTL